MKQIIALSVLVSMLSPFAFAETLIPEKTQPVTIEAGLVKTENKVLTIPRNTALQLVAKFPVAGNSLKAGDMLPIQVAKDVEVDGHTVFKSGQDAVLFVKKSKKPGIWGRGGVLIIDNGSIKDAFGNEHSLQVTREIEGDDKASGIVLPIVSLIVLWPLVFCTLIKGEESVLGAGTLIPAFTTSEVKVALK